MSVSTYISPDSTTQATMEYFPIVDGDFSVVSHLAAAFAPHEALPTSMSILVDAGLIFVASDVIQVPQQTVAGFIAPVGDPRIDRIVIDRLTGVATLISGAEAPVPAAPTIPPGMLPVARVMLDPSTTQIGNAAIVDERVLPSAGAPSGALLGTRVFTSSATYTPSAGVSKVIVEVQGGGGSAGGTASTSSSRFSASSGGSAGAYAKASISSGFAGVAVTVGQGGASPAAGQNEGNTGGSSSFGSLVIAPGGLGGHGGPSVSQPAIVGAAPTSAAPTGANIAGGVGAQGNHGFLTSSTAVCGGTGGSSHFGGGGNGGGGTAGDNATSPGAGGGGSASLPSTPARSGGAGANGIVIVHEYA